MANAFRQAVETRDVEAMAAALHPDVTFRSPVVFKPYEGRDAVMALLSLVTQVFEDFEYLDELQGDGSTCFDLPCPRRRPRARGHRLHAPRARWARDRADRDGAPVLRRDSAPGRDGREAGCRIVLI